MNDALREKIAARVAELYANGNTPLKEFGINGDLIKAVEKQHPHVAKQYPWQASSQPRVA
tara:strand:+ start:1011 stop:1190 length:180 start_codon:yes stop_codon:yes gene_type:complete